MVHLVLLVPQVEPVFLAKLVFKEIGVNLVYLDLKASLENVVSLEMYQPLLDLRVKMVNLVKMVLMVCLVSLENLDKKETLEIKDLLVETDEMVKMVNEVPREIWANQDLLEILVEKVEMV